MGKCCAAFFPPPHLPSVVAVHVCRRAPEVRARRGRGREGRAGTEEEKWEMEWRRVSGHAERESGGRSVKPYPPTNPPPPASSVGSRNEITPSPSASSSSPLPPLFNITNLTQQRLIVLFSSFLLLSSHLLTSSLSLPSSAVPRAAKGSNPRSRIYLLFSTLLGCPPPPPPPAALPVSYVFSPRAWRC